MSDFFNFSSDKINVFYLLVDSSSSMRNDSGDVVQGIKAYKKSFENFPEVDSIAVALSQFASRFYPGEFTKVCDIPTDYNASGTTALCYSIVKGAQHLMKYIDEVIQRTGCVPRVTFITFSDGEPYEDFSSPREASNTIEKLNLAGFTTVFVAFGKAITSEFGKKLGFQATINVDDRDALVNFLGEELSKSCKEQSKSMKALGANFFSRAIEISASAGYSATTAQALDDDDWIDEI